MILRAAARTRRGTGGFWGWGDLKSDVLLLAAGVGSAGHRLRSGVFFVTVVSLPVML